MQKKTFFMIIGVFKERNANLLSSTHKNLLKNNFKLFYLTKQFNFFLQNKLKNNSNINLNSIFTNEFFIITGDSCKNNFSTLKSAIQNLTKSNIHLFYFIHLSKLVPNFKKVISFLKKDKSTVFAVIKYFLLTKLVLTINNSKYKN
jgi:hypothetical protein